MHSVVSNSWSPLYYLRSTYIFLVLWARSFHRFIWLDLNFYSFSPSRCFKQKTLHYFVIEKKKRYRHEVWTSLQYLEIGFILCQFDFDSIIWLLYQELYLE